MTDSDPAPQSAPLNDPAQAPEDDPQTRLAPEVDEPDADDAERADDDQS